MGPISGTGGGVCHAWTAATDAPCTRASSTAHRSASLDSSEPSTPTTIFSTRVFYRSREQNANEHDLALLRRQREHGPRVPARFADPELSRRELDHERARLRKRSALPRRGRAPRPRQPAEAHA